MIAARLTPAQSLFCDLFDELRRRNLVDGNVIDPLNSLVMRLSRELLGVVTPRRPAAQTPAEIERQFLSPQGFSSAEVGMSVHDPNEAA